ncbi:MAG: hypothetical protein M1820_007332 [Bogoriella megaspora]|nr:MAG: hypothetical protein M1820_007332 [Bogoriella megaspora]
MAKQSDDLAAVATETRSILPYLLLKRPDAAPTGMLYDCVKHLHALNPNRNPKFSTRVIVTNADTLDAALNIPPSTRDQKPVLVLDMANAEVPGGGWLKGSSAQEESICYRSSLSFTLKRRFYPLKVTGAVYSPNVLVIRNSRRNGHTLLDLNHPEAMRTVSVVSVAAVQNPKLFKGASGQRFYQNDQERSVMKHKIMNILRIAGRQNHRRIVLGAFGCGVFGNPRGEVVRMFQEVLSSPEFKGWFESIVFAVLDSSASPLGNFAIFRDCLNGMKV